MSSKFEEWKVRVIQLPEAVAHFEKWLFSSIAGVLLVGKAGELLMLRVEDSELSIDQHICRIAALSQSWGFSHLVLCRSEICARVIMYDPVRVQKTLSDVPQRVLDKLGYSRGIGPTRLLEEVGQRWQEERQIPHEIGLALGYPVKDVLGYMGLVPLQCTGRCRRKPGGKLLPLHIADRQANPSPLFLLPGEPGFNGKPVVERTPENLTGKVKACYTDSGFRKTMHLQKLGVNANEKRRRVFLFDTNVNI